MYQQEHVDQVIDRLRTEPKMLQALVKEIWPHYPLVIVAWTKMLRNEHLMMPADFLQPGRINKVDERSTSNFVFLLAQLALAKASDDAAIEMHMHLKRVETGIADSRGLSDNLYRSLRTLDDEEVQAIIFDALQSYPQPYNELVETVIEQMNVFVLRERLNSPEHELVLPNNIPAEVSLMFQDVSVPNETPQDEILARGRNGIATAIELAPYSVCYAIDNIINCRRTLGEVAPSLDDVADHEAFKQLIAAGVTFSKLASLGARVDELSAVEHTSAEAQAHLQHLMSGLMLADSHHEVLAFRKQVHEAAVAHRGYPVSDDEIRNLATEQADSIFTLAQNIVPDAEHMARIEKAVAEHKQTKQGV